MIQNNEIASLLEEMADLLDIQGENRFKIRAYRMAAGKLREIASPVAKNCGKKELMAIEGIGDAISDKILEIVQTGDFKAHKEVLQKFPRELLLLLKIEGLGPKRVRILFDELQVKNLEDLKKVVEDNLITNLKGFGEKIKEKIVQGIQNIAQSEMRFQLDNVLDVAKAMRARMLALDGVKQVEVAGSLRRWKETVKDLDILVTGDVSQSAKVMEKFVSYDEVKEILQKGETKSSVKLRMGIQVDLRFVSPDCFGASMQYFTGSKEHNIALRTFAKDKGFKTSEYGLFKVKGDQEEKVAGQDETEFYKALGMQFIEPELRENTGEIDRALAGTLPVLITETDIQGDLHIHTTASDGKNTLEEMVEACLARGYRYMAITEHSRSVRIAGGLDNEQLLEWIKKIRSVQEKYPKIQILTGVEVNVMKDGTLDVQNEVLAQCDIVLASVHFYLRMSGEQMTKRILEAMSSPYINVLAHPTARLIQERDPISFDFAQIVDAAVKNGVTLEVNASPQRLDLKDTMVKMAIESGAKLVINTDAHCISHLENMKLGVHTARRGWCRKEDCINTYSIQELKKFLRRKK